MELSDSLEQLKSTCPDVTFRNISDFLKASVTELCNTLHSRRCKKRTFNDGKYASPQALHSHNRIITSNNTATTDNTSVTPITTATTLDANHNTPFDPHKHRRRRRRNKRTTRYWRRNNHNIQLDTNSVINLSNVTLSHDETQLLARGITFCPMPRQIDWNEVRADINEFSRRMRLLEYFHDFPTHIDLNPLYVKSTWTPPQHRDTTLDAFITAVERDILNLTPKPVRDNLTTRERHALKQLRHRTDIIIKAADKGSGTVIMDRNWYINECLRQLNDTKFYRRLETDITSDIQTRVQFFIKRLHKDGVIDDKTKQFLIQADPKPGRFYILPA